MENIPTDRADRANRADGTERIERTKGKDRTERTDRTDLADGTRRTEGISNKMMFFCEMEKTTNVVDNTSEALLHFSSARNIC